MFLKVWKGPLKKGEAKQMHYANDAIAQNAITP